MAPQVLASFIQELQDQTTALQTASGHAHLDALGKAAHRLKSSAASFGAMPLSSSLVDLEQAARNGQMESVLQAMPGVSDLADATLGQLIKLQAAHTTI